MKKFRKWLIHKLGGICEDDIVAPIPILHQKEKEVVKVHIQMPIPKEIHPTSKEIFHILLDKLTMELSKEYFILNTIEQGEYYVYSMDFEYLKPTEKGKSEEDGNKNS